MIFICRESGIVFTGDNLVNINGFSPEQAEFNSLAPYLMRSVNVDSKKATAMRLAVIDMINRLETNTSKPCLVCGGHGPISTLTDGKMTNIQTAEKVIL